MIKLAVIADDLTGANDTALQFAKRGISASVLLGGMRAEPASEVVVVDSDSRDLGPGEAYARVKEIAVGLRRLSPEGVFKKIDSTLRGSWAAEVKAVEDVTQPELVVIAPAYPASGRLTVGGYHLLEGVPLELTEISRSPKTPVYESYIPALIEAQVPGQEAARIDLRTLREGEAATREAIGKALLAGRRWLVVDVAEEKNFLTLTEALKGLEKILWVGSAGLADHIAHFYGWKGEERPLPEAPDGAALVCAGSVSHVTQAQLKAARGRLPLRLVELDAATILASPQAAADYAREIAHALAAGEDVLLASALDDEGVRRASAAGRLKGLSLREVSEEIACTMARIVGSLPTGLLRGLVLTGGDTAAHICAALGTSRVEILAEVEPGVPCGMIETAAGERLLVVTKAGALGSEKAISAALETIRDWKHLPEREKNA